VDGFAGIGFLVKQDGGLRPVPTAEQLDVDAADLARQVHRSFLDRPTPGFRGEFGLPHHPKLVYDWEAVGQTSGMVIWTRRDALWAMSLMLNGLEGPAETLLFEDAMRRRGLPPPPGLWAALRGEKRPLVVMLHADVRSVGDMMLATVAPVMAAAFFGVFGTTDEG
jgi:hypothetical protein